MKTGLLLMVVFPLGCQHTEPGLVEPQGLFRTWTNAGLPQLAANTLIVEFKTDRRLLYGANKQEAWCCSPATFTTTDSQVEFFYDPNPGTACHLIDCGPSLLAIGISWHIDKLTADELVLSAANRTLTFKPY